jgi:hypothetical protein
MPRAPVANCKRGPSENPEYRDWHYRQKMPQSPPWPRDAFPADDFLLIELEAHATRSIGIDERVDLRKPARTISGASRAMDSRLGLRGKYVLIVAGMDRHERF